MAAIPDAQKRRAILMERLRSKVKINWPRIILLTVCFGSLLVGGILGWVVALDVNSGRPKMLNPELQETTSQILFWNSMLFFLPLLFSFLVFLLALLLLGAVDDLFGIIDRPSIDRPLQLPQTNSLTALSRIGFIPAFIRALVMRQASRAVWFLGKPSSEWIEIYLQHQNEKDFTYKETRGTNENEFVPRNFDYDVNKVQLGTGERVFADASTAIRRWKMFPQPWTTIYPPDAGIQEGTTVAVSINTHGLWWLNAARIVYTIDEPRRFGFAYGTLPGHVECGEELFSVEWRNDDSVWYVLRAFSRPRHIWARLAYPLARRAQRRFVRESQAAMVRASNP